MIFFSTCTGHLKLQHPHEVFTAAPATKQATTPQLATLALLPLLSLNLVEMLIFCFYFFLSGSGGVNPLSSISKKQNLSHILHTYLLYTMN